jgi:hypothetical protein
MPHCQVIFLQTFRGMRALCCLLRGDSRRYRGGGVSESHAKGNFKSLKIASEIRKDIFPIGYTFSIFLFCRCVLWVIFYSDLFYLLIVDVEVYYCTWSHTMTHTRTHLVRSPEWGFGTSQRQNTDFLRNQHPFTRRDSNSKSQKPKEADLLLRLCDYRNRRCWWLGDWELSVWDRVIGAWYWR